MPDFTSTIPNYHLKIIFITHFMLISLVAIGQWSSLSYLFYNFVLIGILLWGIFKGDVNEPLEIAIVVNGLSIILDIFLLAMRFPDSHAASERFSAALAIIHLIARPFSCLYLAKILQDRTGSTSNIGSIFPSSRNHNYEDMDKNVPPSQSQPTQGGYDFTSAQQI